MATPKGVIFNSDAVRRIGDVVKRVEGQPVSTSGTPSGTKPYTFGRDLHVNIGTKRGFGKYNATLLLPSDATTINPDAAATLADVGKAYTPPSGVTVIAINTAEIGTNTNCVEANSVWPCTIIRRPTKSSPTLFLSFTGFAFFNCS